MTQPRAVFFNGDQQPQGHYSRAVRSGDFIHVAGQVPRDAAGSIVGATIAEQTVVVLRNLQEALALAGATLDDVIKTSVHLASLDDARAFNETYAQFFPNCPPVRTTVQSGLREVLVEIDAVAWSPTRGGIDVG